MSQAFIQFQHVSFSYESASTLLFQDISIHFSIGWSGIVGANGAGKTTLLKLATGMIAPEEGSIHIPSFAVYCPQRTDESPHQFQQLLQATTKRASILKARLGLLDEWAERWETLSHGERKRAQIAVALWSEPDVLAIDEPTNHIDREAKALITQTLQYFQGVGLLVSHDRELLDLLCRQCVFVEPPSVLARPGGISKSLEIAREEEESLQKEQQAKKRELKRLHRECVKRRETARQADTRRSKRKIGRKDHDAKEKIDRARISGKDAVGGKLLRQLDGRLRHATQQAGSIDVKKNYTLGIWLPGSTSSRDVLARLPAETLSLGERKRLVHPDLHVLPADRIAVSGPNGAGKTTLIRQLLPKLRVPEEHLTYIPQEVAATQAQAALAQVKTLPSASLGHLMTIISRLGSRPQRLLESIEPSPGEMRKLLLALGMTRNPHILILDEPTNHMDLPSIECLERALASCPCCLVLVSHDERFLNALTEIRWRIRPENAERFQLFEER